MPNPAAALDFEAFTVRVGRTSVDPRRAVRAGKNLINGALRLRKGEGRAVNPDDVLGSVMGRKPVTKPAEAVGAWIQSMQSDIDSGQPFERAAELQRALVAAGREVNAAAVSADDEEAPLLRGALYSDALSTIGGLGQSMTSTNLPWVLLTGIFGGILIGLFVAHRRK